MNPSPGKNTHVFHYGFIYYLLNCNVQQLLTSNRLINLSHEIPTIMEKRLLVKDLRIKDFLSRLFNHQIIEQY